MFVMCKDPILEIKSETGLSQIVPAKSKKGLGLELELDNKVTLGHTLSFLSWQKSRSLKV